MNRRGFLRAVGATGLLLRMQGPAVAMTVLRKTVADLLRQALAERRLVEFNYHGFLRRVEPHALGHATGGRPALLAWQVAGGSASEPPPGWRTFVLADIDAPKLLRKNFAVRSDYHPETTKLKPIVAEVAPVGAR